MKAERVLQLLNTVEQLSRELADAQLNQEDSKLVHLLNGAKDSMKSTKIALSNTLNYLYEQNS